MSDRATVWLTVLYSQKEATEAICKSYYIPDGECDAPFMKYLFEEVDYGNLPFLDDLRDAGIPYDSRWGAGYEYGEGVKSLRITADGGFITREMYDAEINPPIDELMKLIGDPAELRKFIIQHHSYGLPLSWDNQEEYVKVFKTKQLISP